MLHFSAQSYLFSCGHDVCDCAGSITQGANHQHSILDFSIEEKRPTNVCVIQDAACILEFQPLNCSYPQLFVCFEIIAVCMYLV